MKKNQILPITGDVLITDKATSSNYIVVNTADQIDFVRSNVYKLMLSSNQNFPIPNEITPGVEYTIIIQQDTVGDRILSFDSQKFIFLQSDSDKINSVANSVSILKLRGDGLLFYCSVTSALTAGGGGGTTTSQYTTYTDGSVNLRVGVRGGVFVLDKTLTANGFDGVQDTDWEQLNSNT